MCRNRKAEHPSPDTRVSVKPNQAVFLLRLPYVLSHRCQKSSAARYAIGLPANVVTRTRMTAPISRSQSADSAGINSLSSLILKSNIALSSSIKTKKGFSSGPAIASPISWRCCGMRRPSTRVLTWPSKSPRSPKALKGSCRRSSKTSSTHANLSFLISGTNRKPNLSLS